MRCSLCQSDSFAALATATILYEMFPASRRFFCRFSRRHCCLILLCLYEMFPAPRRFLCRFSRHRPILRLYEMLPVPCLFLCCFSCRCPILLCLYEMFPVHADSFAALAAATAAQSSSAYMRCSLHHADSFAALAVATAPPPNLPPI